MAEELGGGVAAARGGRGCRNSGGGPRRQWGKAAAGWPNWTRLGLGEEGGGLWSVLWVLGKVSGEL